MNNEEVISRLERLINSGELNTDDTTALKIALDNLKAISSLILKE